MLLDCEANEPEQPVTCPICGRSVMDDDMVQVWLRPDGKKYTSPVPYADYYPGGICGDCAWNQDHDIDDALFFREDEREERLAVCACAVYKERIYQFKNNIDMKNEQSNTTEKGMAYDRLLCTVIGVVTPYERLFRIWIGETGKKMYGDKYKFILLRKIDDVRGREFFAVEKGINYQDVDVEVYDAAVMRIR